MAQPRYPVIIYTLILQVKQDFLQNLLRMCANSRENRRTILQMSVWQEWLISLAYFFPKNDDEAVITELVYNVFCHLLFHAIYLEYGGWRVWVDTLAIAHSKVGFDLFLLFIFVAFFDFIIYSRCGWYKNIRKLHFCLTWTVLRYNLLWALLVLIMTHWMLHLLQFMSFTAVHKQDRCNVVR